MKGLPLSIFSPLEKVLLAFILVLLLTTSTLGFLWHRSKDQTRHAGLHADSLAAALDTSRHVSLSRKDSIRILGDTIQAVGRRVFQVPQKNDALDKAQAQDRIAIANLSAQVAALITKVSSGKPVTTDTATGTRSATFTIDSTPYHDTLQVSLPIAGVGTLKAALHIDGARIGLRLGCGAKTDGIRSANATLTGPPWLSLELGRVEQSAELCNPTPARPGFFKRLFSSCGVGPGYALAFAGGKWVGGPAAVADCHVWP